MRKTSETLHCFSSSVLCCFTENVYLSSQPHERYRRLKIRKPDRDRLYRNGRGSPLYYIDP